MTIRRCTRLGLLAAALALSSTLVTAQGRRDDYDRAERFLAEQIRHLAYDGQVDPRWIGKTNRFWYRKKGPFGKQFVLVDTAQLTSTPAFDHERLAAALSSAARQTYSGRALPFDAIRFTDGEMAVQFEAVRATWTCRLESYVCTRSSDPFEEDEGPIGGGRGGPPTDRLPRTEVPSSDGKLVAFARDHNLWARVRATGEQIQLSHDGEPFYD
jgi:dipeptidyl-peptidase-4